SFVNVVAVVQHRTHQGPVYPFSALECILGSAYPIHECVVDCSMAGTSTRSRYLIAVQERPGTTNPRLSRLLPGPSRGIEVVVMRMSPRGAVVDFGGKVHLSSARKAVRCLLKELDQRMETRELGTPFLFPPRLCSE
ncbi:hypothetical protein BV20DRAFT_953036, partial [Pilatotrama ljubarskyi]